MVDQERQHFFRTWLNSTSVRNNTLIVIGADHGNHKFRSKLHSTALAKDLDQKAPLMYLLVPLWMKKMYPERMEALRVNARQKLTTFADLHFTLKHLLNFKKQTLRSPIAQSLFSPISKNRTCADAAIPSPYCACSNFFPIQKKVGNMLQLRVYD